MALPVFELTLAKTLVLALCLGIVWFGYFKKVTDIWASIVASILGVYFIGLFPLYWFASLLLLYIATSMATRHKNVWKAVNHTTGRGIKNILSNLGIALAFSVMYLVDNQPAFYLAFLCSAACACSDTLASEIGQLSRSKPRLITTWQEVKTGMDGAVSVLGLLSAATGAVLTALPSLWVQPEATALKFFITASIIGFIGCNIDSLVGAQYELRGSVTNDTTNLIATTISGFLGLIAWLILF
ncbi:MAG: DUF92 domain-containing protein [Candidatus Aenigmarchaeota archaeon]|nr:DUF92 domain-containing protein [Candidatus Aenigmarchaeota archaeon]